jgi:predicted kinase
MSELILLVSIPGAGKSTFAQRYSSEIVLSSDKLRGIVGTDESDQSVSGKVFSIMEAMADYFLSQGKDVVVDATNTTRKARKEFIKIGRKNGSKISAYVFPVPLEVAKARNAGRARVVPDFVLDRMHAGFEMPLVGEVDEVKLF